MSDFILIQKKLLKALAQHTPSVNMLRHVLESKYVPVPTNKYKFMLLPCNLDTHPGAYFMSECAEWESLHIVGAFIEKHCPQLPEEEQMRIVNRLHSKFIRNFTCVVQVLGETLPLLTMDVISKAIAPKSIEPQDIENIIKSLWKQCEKAMEKVAKEDEKKKKSGS